MSALNPKLRQRLEAFIDENEPEAVDSVIAFLRDLGAADRIFVAEWLDEVRTERLERDFVK